MSNEGDKRKHAATANHVVQEGSQKKAREVTDEEVDEFYAILRRINKAVKYFKSGSDHGVASQGRWRASLEEEIMQEVKGGGTRNPREEENLTLDLNMSPQPE